MRSLCWGGKVHAYSLLWRRPAGSHTESDRPFFGRCMPPVLAARKGDGKQQRKPKTDAQEETRPPPSPSPAPARVDPNLGIPLRYQLVLVGNKKAEKRGALPKPSTHTKSFRKPTKTTEEYKAEKREKQAAELTMTKVEMKSLALSQIHGSMNSRQKTVLLVDGYNIIGHKNNKAQGNSLLGPGELLEEERCKLIERLGIYSQQVGVRVVVAFDAMGAGIRPTQEELHKNGVTTVYCCDQEADSYIAFAIDLYRNKGYHLIAVATNDQLVRMGNDYRVFNHARFGKQEVYTMSVNRLKNDMKRERQRMMQLLEEHNEKPVIGVGLAPHLTAEQAARLNATRKNTQPVGLISLQALKGRLKTRQAG